MRANIGLFLTKRAQLGGELEALVELERGRRFRYAELEARSNRIANALAGLGVQKGDRVAVLMMNGVEYLECYFGLAKIGGVLVPLNWRLVPSELEFILNDSGSTALLYDSEFDDTAAALRELETPLATWVRVGSGTAPSDVVLDYDAVQGAASSDLPEIAAEGDDDLFIMYTSGTTGSPKGVVHSHDTMIAASTTISLTADMRLGDRFLQVLPMFHVGALSPGTSVIHRGGTQVMMRSFDPAAVFPASRATSVTRDLRSWRTSTGRVRLQMMRSPSQWPTSALCSTFSGR